jgi:sugar/nucleoside kinase (ribokinase family)
MPRLLAVGHVCWDRLQGQQVLGGSVSYATLAARRLGWEAAALTAAGPDFDPARDLPGVTVFRSGSAATTRFTNLYGADGVRQQVLSSRADAIDLGRLPEEWRDPDVLLLGGVAAEIAPRTAQAFQAEVVGANAQGWLRAFDVDGTVHAQEWKDPAADLAGVHVLFLSEHDLPDARARCRELLGIVPVIALTRGWRGLVLMTRGAEEEIGGLPRQEVDPNGAGDVFAATFLMRYHETGDLAQAAAVAACGASCVVEGLAASTLGDRPEIERRMVMRDRLHEEGEWEE